MQLNKLKPAVKKTTKPYKKKQKQQQQQNRNKIKNNKEKFNLKNYLIKHY